MSTLSYSQLVAACEAGGASALSMVTELAPAGGPHAAVAPANYVVGRDTPAFAYETRFIDGQPATAVVIDAKQSQLNRIEAAILQCIRDEHPLLSRVPRVRVSYGGGVSYTDLELPQRIFDGHILAGAADGRPVAEHPVYRAARDCSLDNARVLLELSPGSLVLGSWDSTRKSRQARYRSAVTGEIIGVLADQRSGAPRESRSGAARVDPVGDAVPLTAEQLRTVIAGQRSELRPDLVDSSDAALLGLGSTPATLKGPGAVSCSRIIRTQVLSFAALRELRFDAGPAGDAACRALLAAYALAGLARANAELTIRANCDLVEAAPTAVKLDARDGEFITLDVPSIDDADELLEQALDAARREADIAWRGQVFDVTGNPAIYAAASAGVPADNGADRRSPRRFRLPHFIESRTTRG